VTRFVFLTFDGLSRGAIYAAVALSLVVIWRGTRIVNFAQGAMAMVTAFLAFSVLSATGSWTLGLLVALVAGLALGAAVERGLMRRVAGGPELNAVIVALGLLIVLEAGAGMVYGNAFRGFPTPVGRNAYRVGSLAILSPYDLLTLGAVLLVMVAASVLFLRTPTGLRMRASAFAPEVARLLGVRVGRTLTLSWALAALVGSLAGVLVSPTVFLFPNNMDGVFVAGFTAAVVGGLDSLPGAVLGGIVTGLVLSYAGGYLGSDLTDVAALALLVVVLLTRPAGLLARTRGRVV
jgi:branched-chain amino acid transport system permease protein